MKKTLSSEEAFQEACKVLGYDPANVIPDVSRQPVTLQKSTVAGIKLNVIADAMKVNKPLVPGKNRWFPVFNNTLDTSSFGFSRSFDWRTFTDTSVGARREFNNEADSDQFGKQFIDLHKEEKCIFSENDFAAPAENEFEEK